MCSSGNTSSLDQLIDKFSSIKISKQNNFKMSPPSTTSTPNNDNSNSDTLLKLYVDTIPNYDGDTDTLEIFINSCEYLFTTFGCITEIKD
jgi:hypothetical protein